MAPRPIPKITTQRRDVGICGSFGTTPIFFVRVRPADMPLVEVDVYLDRLPGRPARLAETRFVVDGTLEDGEKLAHSVIAWWIRSAQK
jgi:hypothetical protein